MIQACINVDTKSLFMIVEKYFCLITGIFSDESITCIHSKEDKTHIIAVKNRNRDQNI